MATVRGYVELQRRLHAAADTTGLMRQVGLGTVREAKLLVHRKTGNTGRSIRLSSVTATRATVTAGGAAPFLEFGTKPHVITPKVARVLAWGGARRLSGALRAGAVPTHFAMVVHHPGSRPYPFLMPGAKAAVAKVGVEGITESWNSAA